MRIRIEGVDAAANPLLSSDRTIHKAAVSQLRKAARLIERHADKNIRRTFRGFRKGKPAGLRLREAMRVRVVDDKSTVTAVILPVGLGRAQGTTLELGGRVSRDASTPFILRGSRAGQRKIGKSARARPRHAHTADYGSPRPFLGPAVDATQEKVFEMIGATFDVLGGRT